MRPHDAGHYQCASTNRAGRNDRDFHLRVLGEFIQKSRTQVSDFTFLQLKMQDFGEMSLCSWTSRFGRCHCILEQVVLGDVTV